jgi:hypothetical protein
VCGPLNVGKLDRQGRLNAVVPGSLVHIVNQLSNRRFLVDTGASYSIFPHTSAATPSGPRLRGAAGQLIPCWGEKTFDLSFQGRQFSWTFLLAAVSFPIIGVDFLRHFKLMVDPAANALVDKCSRESFATVSTLTAAAAAAGGPPPAALIGHRHPQSPASSVTGLSQQRIQCCGCHGGKSGQWSAADRAAGRPLFSSVTGLSSQRFRCGGRLGGGSGQLCTAADRVPGRGQQL